MQVEDMTGQTYGRLTVVARIGRKDNVTGKYGKDTWWLCECSCTPGKTVEKARTYLKSSPRPHCGCLTQENRMRARKMGQEAMLQRMKEGTEHVKIQESFMGNYIRKLICPICKKEFEQLSREWVYKVNEKVVCSWTCTRKAEAEEAQKRKTRKRGL